MSFYTRTNPTKQIEPNTNIAHRDKTLKNKGIIPVYDQNFDKFEKIKTEEVSLQKKIKEQKKDLPKYV